MSKLKCDKCGNNIPPGSKFCPQCGDLVNEADKISNQESKQETVKLVCPKCEKQNLYKMNVTNHASVIACSNCKSQFKSRIVTIRSKKSRGSKKDSKRSFSIRVKDLLGNEDFIEFENSGYDDFELKSKDLVSFNYLKGKLKIVHNITLNQYMVVSNPSCFIASCIYGSGSDEVFLLRSWRDKFLLSSILGTVFVRLYYLSSPKIVSFIESRPKLIAIIKSVLDRVVTTVKNKEQAL